MKPKNKKTGMNHLFVNNVIMSRLIIDFRVNGKICVCALNFLQTLKLILFYNFSTTNEWIKSLTFKKRSHVSYKFPLVIFINITAGYI